MNIGLDIHGVIDSYPKLFSNLSKKWIEQDHEIFIVTGQEWQEVKPIVEEAGVCYTHHFSIVDHHKNIGTPMYKRSDKDGWWMDKDIWMRSKGDYAMYADLDIHFDDSVEYAKYFPSSCTYVIVPRKNFVLDRLF